MTEPFLSSSHFCSSEKSGTIIVLSYIPYENWRPKLVRWIVGMCVDTTSFIKESCGHLFWM